MKPTIHHFSICSDLYVCGPIHIWISKLFLICYILFLQLPLAKFPLLMSNFHFFTIQLQNTISKSMCFRVSYVCKLSNFDDAKLGWYFFGFNDCLPPTLMKHITPPSNPYIHGVCITFNQQGVNRNELLQLLMTGKNSSSYWCQICQRTNACAEGLVFVVLYEK